MQQLWLTCFKCSDMSLFIGNTAVFYELTIHKTAYLFRNMVAASLAYVQNLNQSACNGKQSPLAFVNARYMLTQRVWLVMRHEHELPCTCPVHALYTQLDAALHDNQPYVVSAGSITCGLQVRFGVS